MSLYGSIPATSHLFVALIVAVLSWVGGFVVRWILRASTGDTAPPKGFSEESWSSLVSPLGRKSGAWLGFLERIVFALAFLMQGAFLVAGWLALKLGSKWQTWAGISSTPDSYEGMSDEEWFSARRKLAALLSQRFLIGTLANVLLGLAIAVTAKMAANVLLLMLGLGSM